MSSHPVNIDDHNFSPQRNVELNPDPALRLSNEHHHEHLHHSRLASLGREDNIVYTNGTTDEPRVIPHQDAMDHALHRKHSAEAAAAATKNEKEKLDIFDAEKGSSRSVSEEADPRSHKLARFYAHWKIAIHLIIFMLFTGWWIAGLILHRFDMNWIIPFLLWLCITIRLVTFYIPITIVTKPMHFVWNNTGVRFADMVPEKLKIPLGGLLVLVVYFLGAFVSPEVGDNTRASRAISIFGLCVFIAGLYITSTNRKKINWHTVIVGMLVQFLIALFVLRTKTGFDIFSFISSLARALLGAADQGTAFLTDSTVPNLPWFFTGVIPAIIFFVAFVQLLFYWGILQWVIGKFAVFFFWSMRVSGAEAIVAAASPFIGQGESAMLIRPFVAHLTQAELHQVMCSGFATIAGSVLVAYIHLGVNPQALVSSCVMSIPASLAISKLRFPEEEETLTAGRVVIPDDEEHRSVNAIHAFANGAWLGLKIGGMIVSTLLCIIALLGLANSLLGWWGHYLNINNPDLSIEMIVGYLCYPIAFLLGVPRNGDLYLVAKLIGTKLIANEFVAYTALTTDPQYLVMSARSKLIVTYALCGFANIGSLGTQIGVLSQIAPGRSGDVSRLALSALIAGALSTFTSASIAGMLVTDESAYLSTSS